MSDGCSGCPPRCPKCDRSIPYEDAFHDCRCPSISPNKLPCRLGGGHMGDHRCPPWIWTDLGICWLEDK